MPVNTRPAPLIDLIRQMLTVDSALRPDITAVIELFSKVGGWCLPKRSNQSILPGAQLKLSSLVLLLLFVCATSGELQ